MKKTKMPKKPCLGCGKPTVIGVPYCICKECSQVIRKWEDAKERTTQMYRSVAGIKQEKFRGDDDISETLNYIGRNIANIEEELMWMKNCLQNIQIQKEYEFEKKKK
jgi:hypothetical protein